MDPHEGWITGDQMHAELVAAGARVSQTQIERWRRNELLPRPKQIGRGRALGSLVMVPPESAKQAIEIARLFRIREKRDWVGWQLWMQGYTVGERYWRLPMEQARASLLRTQQAARNFVDPAQDDGPGLDTIRSLTLAAVRDTPLYASLAKMDPAFLETLIGFASEIVSGQFGGFSREGDAKPDRRELSAVKAVLGASAADRHAVGGIRINLDPIEPILRELSTAFGNSDPNAPLAEPPIELRRELAQAIGIATSLYQALSPVFGRKALGLGTLNWIAANASITLQASLLIIWSEFRLISEEIMTSAEITTLSRDAGALLELAEQWRAHFDDSPPEEQSKLLTDLRKAISGSNRNKGSTDNLRN